MRSTLPHLARTSTPAPPLLPLSRTLFCLTADYWRARAQLKRLTASPADVAAAALPPVRQVASKWLMVATYRPPDRPGAASPQRWRAA